MDERMKVVHVFSGSMDAWTETLCGVARSDTEPRGSYEEALGRATRGECWDLISVEVLRRVLRETPELKERVCVDCRLRERGTPEDRDANLALERIGLAFLSVVGSPLLGHAVQAVPLRARVVGAVVVGAYRALTPELAGVPLSGPTNELQRRANEVINGFVREALR